MLMKVTVIHNNKAVSPIVATILLILIAIGAAVLLYNVLMTQQQQAERAAGNGLGLPDVRIEAVTVTNYSIVAHIRVENAPATFQDAYLYDINNTLTAKLRTLHPQRALPGTVVSIEYYLDHQALPGHYRLVAATVEGISAEKHFETPINISNTVFLENVTHLNNNLANSVNTTDEMGTYYAYFDTSTNRVYFRVDPSPPGITYLRVALYNDSNRNLVSVGSNPAEFTYSPPTTGPLTGYWSPVLQAWEPFTVVISVSCSEC